MENDVLVEGDYGQGAYAPTIRLTARRPDGVRLLRSVFDALAQAQPGQTRQLDDVPGIELGAAIFALRLRVTATAPRRHLVRDAAGGHQLLTSEVEDDALV